ncbi:hypothetical protein [Achromobacter xylosoxidans]|uniref:hypothetical protein n=1 Tax=Alcaligenes xylosoxydans xylosoxydans TaxID=85698 RepID=UPI0009BC65DD|nr:hypothetical protein [Achromobacter xylosoxidans]
MQELEQIPIGQVANDKTGDPLRNGMAKVNANFTKVQTGVDAVELTLASTAQTATEAKATADSAIPAAQKGMAGGVAPLDATGKVPAAHLEDYLLAEEKGAALGVAPLDANGKVPAVNLPAAEDSIPLTQKGAAGGVATLDSNQLIPVAQLPAMSRAEAEAGSSTVPRAVSAYVMSWAVYAQRRTFDQGAVPATNIGDIWVNGIGPCRWDGTDNKYYSIPGSRGIRRVVTLSENWTPDAWTKSVFATVQSGGGGGGGSVLTTGYGGGGGGGGAGRMSQGWVATTPGVAMAIVVGAGGGTATAGGASSFAGLNPAAGAAGKNAIAGGYGGAGASGGGIAGADRTSLRGGSGGNGGASFFGAGGTGGEAASGSSGLAGSSPDAGAYGAGGGGAGGGGDGAFGVGGAAGRGGVVIIEY